MFSHPQWRLAAQQQTKLPATPRERFLLKDIQPCVNFKTASTNLFGSPRVLLHNIAVPPPEPQQLLLFRTSHSPCPSAPAAVLGGPSPHSTPNTLPLPLHPFAILPSINPDQKPYEHSNPAPNRPWQAGEYASIRINRQMRTALSVCDHPVDVRGLRCDTIHRSPMVTLRCSLH
jgi:hypothetical protein